MRRYASKSFIHFNWKSVPASSFPSPLVKGGQGGGQDSTSRHINFPIAFNTLFECLLSGAWTLAINKGRTNQGFDYILRAATETGTISNDTGAQGQCFWVAFGK